MTRHQWRRACRVSVPSRMAISALDMNEFSRGVAGGGNFGLAIALETEVVIAAGGASSAIPPCQPASEDQKGLFRHCVDIWEKEVAAASVSAPDFAVVSAPPAHVGMASSSAFQVAVYAGLNWMSGNPLSDSQIIDVTSRNYREADGGVISPGFTTGLSAHLNLFGGFVVLDTGMEVLSQGALPRWKVRVYQPVGWGTTSFGDEEAKLLMGEGRRLDDRDRDEKRAILEGMVLPAVASGSLDGLGAAVARMQALGNKRCEVEMHGPRMKAAMDALSAAGVPCVFMSALGPSIVAVSDEWPELIARVAEESEISLRVNSVVQNEGLSIRTVSSQ